MTEQPREITRILRRLPHEEGEALERDWEIIFEEILRMARAERRRWQGNETMETGALANEVYLKVFAGGKRDYRDRKHFHRLVAKATRQILINYAEKRSAAKRGGGARHVDLEHASGVEVRGGLGSDIRRVQDSMERLRDVDARMADVVDLKLFAGLTNNEVAEALEISRATVVRDWEAARNWFREDLGR